MYMRFIIMTNTRDKDRLVVCPECQGKLYVNNKKCEICMGKGSVSERKRANYLDYLKKMAAKKPLQLVLHFKGLQ